MKVKTTVFLFCIFGFILSINFSLEGMFSELMLCPFVRQTEGKGIGYSHGYTTVGTLASVNMCNSFIPFFDFRGHRFDGRKRYAANLGAGTRYFINSCNVVGINAYYDYRQAHSKGFNQLGLGLEWLGQCFSLRVNGYLPVGNKTRKQWTQVCTYPGEYFYIRKKYAHAMCGLDAEFEALLICTQKFALYGALGPYYLHENWRHHHSRHTFGSQYRLEANLGNYIVAEAGVTHDGIFRTKGLFQLTFNFPISWGCCKEDSNFYVMGMMTKPVRRHEIIALHRHTRSKQNY